MKQLILLTLLLTISLKAKKITLLSDEYHKIMKSYDKKKIATRLVNYNNLLKKAKNFSTIKKLSYTNTFYNKIPSINDNHQYGIGDYWATPKEFLIEGKGDCEDYAIAKYFTLITLGIKKEKLFLGVVKIENSTNHHMVLLYIKNKHSMPLVLDNLNFKILPFDKRKKLKPIFIFNEKSSYTLKNKIIDKSVKVNWGKENKWKKLLKKIYENNE